MSGIGYAVVAPYRVFVGKLTRGAEGWVRATVEAPDGTRHSGLLGVTIFDDPAAAVKAVDERRYRHAKAMKTAAEKAATANPEQIVAVAMAAYSEAEAASTGGGD